MVASYYLASSLLVGLLAIGRRGGFFFYFAISLIASPIAGLIILLITTGTFDRRGQCRGETPRDQDANRPAPCRAQGT